MLHKQLSLASTLLALSGSRISVVSAAPVEFDPDAPRFSCEDASSSPASPLRLIGVDTSLAATTILLDPIGNVGAPTTADGSDVESGVTDTTAKGRMCVLSRWTAPLWEKTDGEGFYYPLGRSVAGVPGESSTGGQDGDWNRPPGQASWQLSYTCGEATFNGTNFVEGEYLCEVTLPMTSKPDIKDPSIIYAIAVPYYLTYYERTLSLRNELSRFLHLTTFGPKVAELDALEAAYDVILDEGYLDSTLNPNVTANGTTVNGTTTYTHSMAMSKLQVEWVAAQMDPSTFTSGKFSSHREYWRKRLNPRKWETYRIGEAGPAPCEQHSRWRKFAFTEYDVQNSRILRWGTQDLGGAYQVAEGHKVTIETVILENMPSSQPSVSSVPSVSMAPTSMPSLPLPTASPFASSTDAPSISSAPTGSNIIGFGDFEDATDTQILNSWPARMPQNVIRLNPNITDPSLDPNTPLVHSGSTSLEVVSGRGFMFRQIGGSCPEARLSEPINAGDIIRIKLWVRPKVANKVFTIYTGHYHTGKSRVWAQVKDNSNIVSRTKLTAANVWTLVEAVHVVGDDWKFDGVILPPERCNHYQLRFRVERSTAGFYVDDLTIDKIASGSSKALLEREVQHGFIKNPDFAMNYQYWMPSLRSGDIIRNDELGKNVMRLKRGQMAMQNIAEHAIPNERYQFTFWAKLSGTPKVEVRAIARMRFQNNDTVNGPCKRSVCNLYAKPLVKVIEQNGMEWQRILSDEFNMFGDYTTWDGTVSFIRFTVFTRNMDQAGELQLSNFEFVGEHSLTGETVTLSPTISHTPTDKPTMHHSEGNIRYVIRYAGEIRTMTTYPLQLDSGELLVMDGVRQYELCQVDEVEGKYGIYPNRMNFVVGGKCRAIRGGNPTVEIDPSFVDAAGLHILDLSAAGSPPITPINFDQTYGGDLLLQSAVGNDVCETFPNPYDNDYRGADPVNPEDTPHRFNPDKPVFALLPDGSYALYDSRLVTYENSLEFPKLDGGGKSVLRSTIRAGRDGFEASVMPDGRNQYFVFNDQNIALCMNEQPNFINRDHCVLSYDENACMKKSNSFVDVQLVITFTPETLAAMHNATLASYRAADPAAGIAERDNSRFIYAVSNLRFDDSIADGTIEGTKIDLPCYREHGNPTSRWIPRPDLDATTCSNSLHEDTVAVLKHTLETSNDENPYMRDIVLWNQIEGDACNEVDLLEYGMLIMTDDGCWENVHPDHLSIFDFTDYVAAHPMPTTPDNSITGFKDIGILEYPSSHPMSYFEDLKAEEGVLIKSLARYVYATTSRVNQNARIGDTMVVDQFSQMIGMSNDRSNLLAVADNLGKMMLSNQVESNRGGGTLVCGSPNEVQSDPTLDDYFDTQEADLDCIGCQNSYGNYYAQKQSVWTMNVLEGEDQLCQRMSWALYEHLNVGITTAPDNTETNLVTYDIPTRNCFGSYFDVLKEMMYSPKMGEQFNSIGSQSSRQPWDTSKLLIFPDENLGRESMQLFTVGLKELNPDGTIKVDKFGRSSQTYDNKDIMSNARILTGFVYSSRRGNVEELFRSQKSRMDPMRIEIDSHDFFPKSSLGGGWIGDRYPLCVDLPRHHFLRVGATFRFRGGSSMPQSHYAPGHWESDESIRRFVLSPESSLYMKLCNPDESGKCQFASTVMLDANLPCHHRECRVDDVIMIQVTPGAFYEYIRQPCVHLSFYNDAKKVVTGYANAGEGSAGSRRHTHAMCANPLIASAARSCCDIEFTDVAEYNYKMEYHGERTLFASTSAQCLADGGRVCDSDGLIADNPLVNVRTNYDRIYPSENTFFWTDASCTLSLKVRSDGMVAIIHEALVNPFFNDYTVPYVDSGNTITYINVPWERDSMTSEEIFPSVAGNECGGGACTVTSDDMCHCQVTLSETPVFATLPSREDVLSSLMLGAFDPSAFTDDNATLATYSLFESSDDVEAYVASDESSIGASSTIFKVTDEFGNPLHLKNMVSTITLGGLYTLRNLPNFIDLAAPELRDAEFEVDAFLMSLIQYPSSPPFISKKLLQLHGFSNPSPGHVQRVAEAFMMGTYTKGGKTFGDGRYGSLAAVSAAIVLDPESVSPVLDEDPIQGNIREPLLKVISVMRSMDFQRRSSVKIRHGLLENMRSKIGQMVFEPPDQFGFFSTDYEPPGSFAATRLVAPEAELLAMSDVVGLTNGLWSLYNYGLSHLFGGFGPYLTNIVQVGDYSSSVGHLHYKPSVSDVSDKLNELDTLLTAGRLSNENKQVLIEAYNNFYAKNGTEVADRILMKLLSSTPEFHASNTVRRTGEARPVTPPPEMSDTEYKAVVYVNLFGGLDSFNVLTPHDNGGMCYLYDDYFTARGGSAGIGLTMDEILPIDGRSAGITGCITFGVNNLLPAFRDIYNEGKGIFLANMGHLHKPVTKDNWQTETRTDLFSHHTMKKESHEVDAFKEGEGPGVLGRMLDVLERNGDAVSATAVNSRAAMIDGSPKTGRLADILSTENIARIYETNWLNDKSQDLREYLESLNGRTSEVSGLFSNKWSQTFVDVWNKTDALVGSIRGVKPDSSFSTHLDANAIGSQLKLIARLIKIRNERGSGVNRDVFHAQMSGFDAHFKLSTNLAGRLPSLNLAIANFWTEMKAQGVEDQVTVIVGSEFGRTITPNANQGSDHAWAGNYFMFGGDVKGGKILGEYPRSFGESNPMNIGRGRLIPSRPWESLYYGLAQWFGITDLDDINYVVPNNNNFGCLLYTDKDLFTSGAQSLKGCGGPEYTSPVTLQVPEPRHLIGEEQKSVCKLAVKSMGKKLGFEPTNSRCYVADQVIKPSVIAPGSFDVEGVAMISFDKTVPPGKVSQDKVNDVMVVAASIAADFVVLEALPQSAAPSSTPSLSPSVSSQPSFQPSVSSMPSSEPSDQPSAFPTVSSMPSGEPSISSMPTTSAPTTTNPPTNAPSISHAPTLSTYPTPSPTARAVFGEVFASRDIGSVHSTGGFSSPESGLYMVQGSGDIWGTEDSFHYQYIETSGDMTFTALIEGLSAADPWAEAGIMVRGALTPQSSHYSMVLTKGQGVANLYRHGSSTNTTLVRNWLYMPSSVWIKVTKVGNVLSAYYRPTTSSTWYNFGVTISIVDIQSSGYYVGIAVASHTTSSVATVDVSNIQLSRVCSSASITSLQCEQASNCVWGGMSSTCYDKGTKPSWEDGYNHSGPLVASVLDPSSTVVAENCDEMESGGSAYVVDGSTMHYSCDRSSYLSEAPSLVLSPSYGQLSLVNGIRVYTGYDPDADPTSFQLQGRVVTGSLVRDKWDNLCWEVKIDDEYKVMPSACDQSNPLQLFSKTPWGYIHVQGLPGMCLDQRTDMWSDFYFHECHGGDNQRWSFDAASRRLSSLHNGDCIDYNYNTGYLFPNVCHGGANQNFYWQEETWNEVSGMGTTLLERHSGLYCMQVDPSDGYRIKPATCDASNPYQQFYSTPDRFVKVTAEPSKCLDQRLDGVSELYVGDCHGGNNQQWTYDPETETLSSVHDGACADFNYDSNYLTHHPCHGENNQKLSLGSESFFPGRSWQDIASGSLSEVSVYDRNAEGSTIWSSYSSGDSGKYFSEASFFGNTNVYSEYRVVFPSQRASNYPYLQLAEIELTGLIVDLPLEESLSEEGSGSDYFDVTQSFEGYCRDASQNSYDEIRPAYPGHITSVEQCADWCFKFAPYPVQSGGLVGFSFSSSYELCWCAFEAGTIPPNLQNDPPVDFTLTPGVAYGPPVNHPGIVEDFSFEKNGNFQCYKRDKTKVGVYMQANLNGASGGGCGTESDNLVSIVKNFIQTDGAFSGFVVDESIVTFADSTLAQKLASMRFFFMVDMESTVTGWDATSQGVLRNFVETGGTLVMTGTYGTNDVNFLNEAFGWDLSAVGCATSNINTVNTAGTPWEGGAATLGCPSATQHINCGSVSCTTMWGTPTSSAVAVLPHGTGRVIYLGFDFYNTGYQVDGWHVDCGSRTDPWVTSAFRNSLLYAKSVSNAPTEETAVAI